MGLGIRAGVALVGCALAFAVAASCDGSSESVTSTNAGGAGGGTGGNPSQGGGGFSSGQCDPPCVSPQFCSVSGACLDEGHCADDGDCPDGADCLDSGLCSGCEPPNMLIVLDRSCSMQDEVGGTPKWELAVAAINTLTTTYQDQIFFGMTLFPDTVPTTCAQDVIPIPVAPSNETAIQDLLNAALVATDPYYPDGPCVTNIDTGMEQASTQEPAFDVLDRPSYVLLISDGAQAGCNDAGGDAGTLQIITDLFQQRMIATFVVGFGGAADEDQLNEFGLAGGVPAGDATCTPDPCEFYKAEDGPALEAALDAIASQINCNPDDPE